MLGKKKIKYIQSLGQKKFRQEEGLFIAEGPKIVQELLEADVTAVKELYALQEWIHDNKELIGKNQVIEITEIELEKISQLATPNKVVALVLHYEKQPIFTVTDQVTIVLDNIQDPGNLGTLIRLADWFGVSQLICSPDSADLYNPKVVQSTMGSIARVNVQYIELEPWLKSLQNINIYAASLDGEDVSTMKKIDEGIIIIGNESKGISPGLMDLCHKKITIPKKGKAESLNAAVAAGIILSHVY